VLAAVAIHLCFLPWALGTMHVWSQVTSLVLAAIGLLLALIPRTYSGDLAPPVSGIQFPVVGPASTGHRPPPTAFRLNPLPRLVRFPLFWIGLALLAYIAVQGFNPSWVWERNATTWWLRRVNDIPWLPTSIDTPFERFNLWRQFIIYASAWLTVCTVWIGFTRRHALELLLTLLSLNGIALAVTGFIRVFVTPDWAWVLWLDQPLNGATAFSSFIYKNHAGAYLALLASVAATLAAVNYHRGLRHLARSTPDILWLVAVVCIGFGVSFTYSRGAMLILLGFLVGALMVHTVARFIARTSSTTHPMVWLIATILVLVTISFSASQLDYRRAMRAYSSLIDRKESDESVALRLEAYSAGGEMLGDYWPRGVGAGGFRYMFPEYAKHHPLIYREGRLFWDNLHRDWYQIPIELGTGGCALIILAASWWGSMFFRRRSWADPVILILTLGCIQTPIQAWFDFPFANPAVLLTWCTLGLVVLRWSELDRIA
jgi:hypothetical protein